MLINHKIMIFYFLLNPYFLTFYGAHIHFDNKEKTCPEKGLLCHNTSELEGTLETKTHMAG